MRCERRLLDSAPVKRDETVQTLATLYRWIDNTTTVLEAVGPAASRVSAGPRRVMLVNLLIGASDERARRMETARQLLRSARAEVERDCGPDRAAAHFAAMEARHATSRVSERDWREMMALLLAPAPLSAA
jgi:hypothetical protein